MGSERFIAWLERRGRRVAAGAVGLGLVCVVVVGLLLAPAAAADDRLPDARAKLDRIDRILDIAQRNLAYLNSFSNPFAEAATALGDIKASLGNDDFPHVYGHPFAFWFEKFECVDQKLAAIYYPYHPQTDPPPSQTEPVLRQEAFNCADSVEEGLKGVQGIDHEVKQRAFTKLNSIKTILQKHEGNYVGRVKTFKLLLMGKDFPPVYGDTFRDWFVPLECIDEEMLAIGPELDSGDPSDMHYGPGGSAQLAHLTKARQCSHQLRRKLLPVLKRRCRHSHSCKKHTRPKTGPPCFAPSTSKSLPLLVATPPSSAPGTADYWFRTPIPNWAYYHHKHGWRDGGCNYPDKVKVRLEVRGTDGSLISWHYEWPPYPSGPDGQPHPVGHSNYCPKEALYNGQYATLQTCRIYEPSLAFPLPSQGYSGPPLKDDSSSYPYYAVTVRLQNQYGSEGAGTAASIYVNVALKPASR